MSPWTPILDVLLLLAGGLVLGTVFERFRQSAILGYILTGLVVGPRGLRLVTGEEEVRALADLGVTLLLFSIGLEFSWPRLRSLGALALGGGALQVLGTLVLAGAFALVLGASPRGAIAAGAAVALSSTACVLRLLRDRTELDSLHGRASLGILLLQDVAVVPLVVLVTALGGRGTLLDVLAALGFKLALIVPFVAAAWVLFARVVPWVLGREFIARSREIPILLAAVTALGSAFAADRIGLSPALGAFVAGVLLAESPFATQVRSDVAPPRTLLVTLFFGAIGMLADPGWMLAHAPLLAVVVVAILGIKTAVVWAVLRLFRQRHATGLAAGLSLAQVGEFSFLLVSAGGAAFLRAEALDLLVSAIVVTLFLTPFLLAAAGRVANRVAPPRTVAAPTGEGTAPLALVVGFGPAGQAAAAALRAAGWRGLVLDVNPRLLEIAREMGLDAQVGDATQAEVLEHLPAGDLRLAIVTVPDPTAARTIVEQVRLLLPRLPVVARARYHRSRDTLVRTGADVVVDEEVEVGRALAERIRGLVEPEAPEPSG